MDCCRDEQGVGTVNGGWWDQATIRTVVAWLELLSDHVQHHQKMAETAGQNKQMPDAVGVWNGVLRGIEEYSRGVEDATGDEPEYAR